MVSEILREIAFQTQFEYAFLLQKIQFKYSFGF